jgi:hypothetical protein
MKSRWLMIPTAAVLVLTSCSGEDVAESVIERQIESGSDGDVDVDIDDGEISIQTEDGEVVMRSDGDQTIIQTEDGEVVMESDGEQTVIQSEDGEMIIGSSSGDLPDDFPPEIPMPDDIAIEYTQSMSLEEGQSFVLGGEVDGDVADVLDDYVAALESAGFTQLQLTTMPDGGFFAYDNGTWAVGGSVGEGSEGGAAFVITVTPAEPG